MSTRPNTYLASIIAARIEASIEPRRGRIETRCGSLQEASMEELRPGSIETMCGSIEEASIGGGIIEGSKSEEYQKRALKQVPE
jgi:hypothetical protein